LHPRLRLLASQSDTDVLFDPDIAAEKTHRGLTGKYATREGLALLLAESNLKFKAVGEKTLLIEVSQVQRLPGTISLSQEERAGRNQSSSSLKAEKKVDVQEIVVTAQKRGNERCLRSRCQYRCSIPNSLLDGNRSDCRIISIKYPDSS